MKIFLFSMLSLLLFVSCHDIKKQDQLKKMDVLTSTVSVISENLNAIDSAKMELIWNEIKVVRKTIQANYHDDTLSTTLGQDLEDYNLAGKQALWVDENLPIARKTVIEIQTRLTQLQKDIQTGNGEREKYNSYIEIEEKQVNELKVFQESLLKNSLEANAKYQELNNKILNYSKQLTLKNRTL